MFWIAIIMLAFMSALAFVLGLRVGFQHGAVASLRALANPNDRKAARMLERINRMRQLRQTYTVPYRRDLDGPWN